MAMKEVITDYSKRAQNQRSLPRKTWLAREALIKAGYKVEVKSPWHLHVRKPGDRLLVNVWPTADKIMVDRDSQATVYPKLMPAVDATFARSHLKIKEKPQTPEQKEFEEYRKDPLAALRKKTQTFVHARKGLMHLSECRLAGCSCGCDCHK